MPGTRITRVRIPEGSRPPFPSCRSSSTAWRGRRRGELSGSVSRLPSRGPSRRGPTAPLRPLLDRPPAPAQYGSGSGAIARPTHEAGQPGCQVRRQGCGIDHGGEVPTHRRHARSRLPLVLRRRRSESPPVREGGRPERSPESRRGGPHRERPRRHEDRAPSARS